MNVVPSRSTCSSVSAAAVDAPQRLALHQLAQQLDDREHELREPALDVLRVGVDAARERVVEARPRRSANGSRSRRRGEDLVPHARASAKQ